MLICTSACMTQGEVQNQAHLLLFFLSRRRWNNKNQTHWRPQLDCESRSHLECWTLKTETTLKVQFSDNRHILNNCLSYIKTKRYKHQWRCTFCYKCCQLYKFKCRRHTQMSTGTRFFFLYKLKNKEKEFTGDHENSQIVKNFCETESIN